MARNLAPDPAEVRDQIRRIRERFAKWRALIEAAEARNAQLSAAQAAADEQPRASESSEDKDRPPDR